MSVSQEQVDAFVQSREGRQQWLPVPAELRPATRAEGYRLQRAVYDALTRHGVQQVGYKIGCTAPESREPFGLDEPIYAGIFAHTQAPTLRQALSAPLVAPAIECEIALRIGTPPTPGGTLSDEALIAAIAQICIACEVVDSRYGAPPPSIGVPTLLADDYLHASFVLGVPMPCPPSQAFTALRTTIVADGKTFTDPAPETLSPLAALRWLVGKLAENGGQLQEGQIIMTGSLLRPVPVHASSSLTMAVEGVGALSTTV